MVGGDKLLEDFVLIMVLAKVDVTEYVVPTVSSVVTFLSHSSSILVQSYSIYLKAHVISNVISYIYALDDGLTRDNYTYALRNKLLIDGFLTLETI